MDAQAQNANMDNTQGNPNFANMDNPNSQNMDNQPLTAGDQAPNQEPQNPFDTTEDEANLANIQAELDQTTSAIDSDFATFYAENMPEEVEEMFFEDRANFLLEVEKAKQSYLQEKLGPLQQQHQELSAKLQDNRNNSAIWEAQYKFSKAYPDADLDEILKFYKEDLSPKQKQKLESDGDLFKMYESIYKLLKGDDEGEQKPTKSKKIPKDTSRAQFGTAGNLDLDLSDSDLPINRR